MSLVPPLSPLALATLLLGLALLAPPPARAQPACPEPVGRLVAAVGPVELERASLVRPVARDDVLCPGDVVRVGPRGRATVALADGGVLRLEQHSVCRVGEGPRGRSLLDLLFGALHFLSRRTQALEVNTPFVNAAVEGTEFVLRVLPDRSRLDVFEGRVRLENPLGQLLVVGGQAAEAEAGRPPVLLRVVVRPRDAVQWALYYPPVLTALAAPGVEVAPPPPALVPAVEAAARGDIAAAFARLDEVSPTARDTPFHILRAGLLLAVGRADEAREDVDRALALAPENAEALALRAVIALAQDDRARALADARRALQREPDSPAAALALSYALQAGLELAAARAVLEDAVARDPGDPLLRARLAELWLMQGHVGRAHREAEAAVALGPEFARARTVRGFVDLARTDVDAAKEAFERAVELEPDAPLPHLGLGLALIRGGDLDAGTHEIEIAAGLDPNDALLRSYLGKAYYEQTLEEEAADALATAKALDPNNPTPWFYDAIRKQTENRPVAALLDLERAIALNDNRAVYRSRLLLDQDQAARAVSLGRIYDDLGFHQLGVNEATRSLTLDPANASAHRFLSDTYRGVRRREISRVSDLLQAQLLQDINVDPVQPSISETGLNIVTRGGPAEAAFNEFTPLFERNRIRLNVSGVAGNNDTLGGEGVVSALYDRFSVSAGAFHFRTDGFRPNADIDDTIYNVYAQAAVTPEFNVQTEFRRRTSEEGDLALNFDPDDFSPGLERTLDHDIARAGLRYSPTPASDLLLSLIYSDREETITNVLNGDRSIDTTDDDGYQAEAQYLHRLDRLNLTTGFGYSRVDRARSFAVEGAFTFETQADSEIAHPRGYLYGNLNLPDPVTWTLGVSADNYDEEALEVRKVSPKAGVQWAITNDLRLRAAAFRTVKPALVTNRTIEPTQIAGFNQFFDDINATEAWRYGVGFDWRPSAGVFVGAEATWRDLNVPVFVDGDVVFEDQDEQTHRAYIFWTPLPEVALGAELIYDRLKVEEGRLTSDAFAFPRDLRTISVPLTIRYFHPLGFFAGFGATFVDQQVERLPGSDFAEGQDTFVVFDASVGYRFPNRLGMVSLEVRNLLDKSFNFQDDNFREFQDAPTVGPFIPDRTILGRITLSW